MKMLCLFSISFLLIFNYSLINIGCYNDVTFSARSGKIKKDDFK